MRKALLATAFVAFCTQAQAQSIGSAAGLIVNPNPLYSFATSYDAKKFCGIKEDGATDDSTALNACIVTIGALGGGTILLPQGTIAAASTIDNQYSNVALQGAGIDLIHNILPNLGQCGTILKWTGADHGTQVWFHSPSDDNGQKRGGGGVSGICFNSGKVAANTGADYGLRITSWRGGQFSFNFFHQEQLGGILFDLVTNLYDVRDDQFNIVEGNVTFNAAASNNNDAGDGIILKGDDAPPSSGSHGTGTAANVSANTFISNYSYVKNGSAIHCYDTDHNVFLHNAANKLPGGTGTGFLMEGSNGSSIGACHKNYIIGWSGGGDTGGVTAGIIAKGTASYTYPSYGNILIAYDDANLSAVSCEAGAKLEAGFRTDGVFGADSCGTLGALYDAGTLVSSKYAALASPTFTGTPAAPTAAADTNTTQVATTAYVVGQAYAKLASPTFTGTATLPTVTVTGNQTTQAHIISNGTALSCTDLAFSTGAGTSPTCTSVTGDDRRFRVSFSTGTTPTASAQVWQVTFKTTYGSTAFCSMLPENNNAATKGNVAYVAPIANGNGIQLFSNGTGLTASTAYIWSYQCLG